MPNKNNKMVTNFSSVKIVIFLRWEMSVVMKFNVQFSQLNAVVGK